MDFIYILIAVAFFALSWGFVVFAGKLMEGEQ